ncbi:ATP-dependent DNA ligase [Streptomyces violarus]|uniref:ATP-dependent DNA ligase n=1 Tax=Streptomyces violarus TaxID=67380 RepID=UPI0021BF003A|nr:ATP-dependent DNA ligase [Streptomyces violarus]MCT9141795.1 ATP-dependent DNA ligase [Streptomyces violarus]
MWTLPEPMLAAPVPHPDLPPGWAAEVKWDGWRALLSWDEGHLVLRSRQGTDLASSFPEVRSGAAQLPDATALDGELVVWEGGRLAFERLQGRLQRRGAGAARIAEAWPAHFVAFDLLRLAGTDTTRWPYRRRRAALENLFAEYQLTAPWALCPTTTDPATVHEWLTNWTAVGLEGVVYKRLESRYEPSVRGWRKYKVRVTEDAVVGAVTGPVTAPRSLLLGRYDTEGRLRYVGRSTTLPQAAGRAVAALLVPAAGDHPWAGWTFSAGWGTRESLHVTLLMPQLVVEVGVDVARDAAGSWRHPARWHRVRPDLSPSDVPHFTPGAPG